MTSPTILLSHSLDADTPGYRGSSAIAIDVVSDMDRGDPSNSIRLSMSNHVGTHVDAPRHFAARGATVTTPDAEFWFFQNPAVVDVRRLELGTLVTAAHLESVGARLDDADIVLLRTGWEALRDSEAYWNTNPGVAADVADFLRERAPQCRCLGMDIISLSGWEERAEGRISHRRFLDHESPIWLIEDMALADPAVDRLKRVLVSPLFVAGADGAPVTVWGWV